MRCQHDGRFLLDATGRHKNGQQKEREIHCIDRLKKKEYGTKDEGQFKSISYVSIFITISNQ